MILIVVIVIYILKKLDFSFSSKLCFLRLYLNVLKLVFFLISSGILFQKPGLTKDQGF